MRLQIKLRFVDLAFTNGLQILQNLFRNQRQFKSIDLTVHIDMEPGCIETYFDLKLEILWGNCSSRQCQNVSRNSGGVQHLSRIREKSRNSGGGGDSVPHTHKLTKIMGLCGLQDGRQ